MVPVKATGAFLGLMLRHEKEKKKMYPNAGEKWALLNLTTKSKLCISDVEDNFNYVISALHR